MEYERLPSGVFFTISSPQVDVQPFVVNQQYERDGASDRASEVRPRQTFPSVAGYLDASSTTSSSLPLRQRREFRVPPSAIDSEHDRRYLPLLEVSLDINVVATVSRTVLKQTYSNHSDITIKEAIYCFPLYDGSAVVKFRAWIGKDRLLEGTIKPKDVARAEFHEAVSRQRAAVLLEELTPEIFETSLGNIPAHTTVKVEIHYINELKADLGGDGVLVTVPTSVAPRYGTPPQDYSRASTSSFTVEPQENGLTIQVEVSSPVPIRKLESRTHPISVELGGESHLVVATSFRDLASASASSDATGFNPKKARATLSNRTTTLGKDFVLLILAADATILASRAMIEHIPNRPDHSALMVTINPRELFGSKIAVENARAEILFIADRSGSMSDKIDTLKRAMRVFLKSIPENCYFNICSFGSSYSLLWPESRGYTQENLEIAEGHVRDCFEANMGGTEILYAIKTVVEKRNILDGVTTEVILLTDGEVWDTDATVKFIQETRTKTDNKVRFFALGIGNAVSHRLVEGIGRQGGGFSEVVTADTAGRWESRVIRMLKGALTPAHWNCEILLPKATPKVQEGAASMAMPTQRPAIVQAPNWITTLHSFQRTSVYFLIDSQLMAKSTSITIQTLTVSREIIQMKIPLEQADAKPLTIHHLAAKAVMNDLETGQSWMHANKYQDYQRENPAAFEEAIKSEAEKIGMEWSIVGKWTSFVAVDIGDQIEQKTCIYRADRSELADLLRPRYLGYSPPPSCYQLPIDSARHIRRPQQSQLEQLEWERSSSMESERGAGMGPRWKSKRGPEGQEFDRMMSKRMSSMEPEEEELECMVSQESGLEQMQRTEPDLNILLNYGDIQGDSVKYDIDSQRPMRNAPPHNHEIADRQPPPTLDTLIGLQKSQGNFFFSDKKLRSRVLEYFAPRAIAELNEQIERYSLSLRWRFGRAEIADTILVIIFIEAQYPGSSELYELVIQKARSWLLKRLHSDERLKELENIARDELRQGKDENEDVEDIEDNGDDKDDAEDLSSKKRQKLQMDIDQDDTKFPS